MEKKILAIGAVGGSGTRMVAEIFQELGYFIGDDLNPAKDNLLFTRLFKNPIWYKKRNENEVANRLRIFRNLMEGKSVSWNDYKVVVKASKNHPTYISKPKFYLDLFSKVLKQPKRISPWGWKEPNSQFYIGPILESIPNSLYIHVIRNGLDMAYAKNNQQIIHWGWRYNIPLSGEETPEEFAKKKLEYWLRATEEVFDLKEKYKDRIYLLSFEKMCLNPEGEIEKLLSFCNLDVDREKKENLKKIPVIPDSLDRYKDHDTSIFEDDQLIRLSNLGYSLE